MGFRVLLIRHYLIQEILVKTIFDIHVIREIIYIISIKFNIDNG
jgi:hypothetical protein